MFNSKAVVQLMKEPVNYEYRFTVFMEIQSESGPVDKTQLLENVDDLYHYFNTFSPTESWRMAEFCLLRGYRVLAHQVNTVIGPASSRKFNDGEGGSLFFSPRQDVDYSEPFHTPFLPVLDSEKAVYSQIISFPDVGASSNNYVSDDFLMVVPKYYVNSSNIASPECCIYACQGWEDVDEKLPYGLGLYSFDKNYSILRWREGQDNPLSYGDFQTEILNFLQDKCNMSVTPIEGTLNSYLIESTIDIADFRVENPYLMGGTEPIITCQASELGKNDNYCRYYDYTKIVTVYSKMNSAVDDIEVVISNADGYYYVDVTKFDSEHTPIDVESFQYSDNPDSPDYLNNLSYDSSLVDIEIHNPNDNIAGTYVLEGKECFTNNEYFIESMNSYEEELSSDFPVDICIDNCPASRTPTERNDYINFLKRCFSNSIIFTDFTPDDTTRVTQISPRVKWRDTGLEMRGFSYLLYLLPDFQNSREEELIKTVYTDEDGAEITLDDAVNIIEERDYGLVLMAVKSKLETIFPIKSLLSVVGIENQIQNYTYTGENDFRNRIRQITEAVNKYMSTSTQVTVDECTVSGRSLNAVLSIRVDKTLIYEYKVTATLLW